MPCLSLVAPLCLFLNKQIAIKKASGEKGMTAKTNGKLKKRKAFKHHPSKNIKKNLKNSGLNAWVPRLFRVPLMELP